MLGPEFLLAVAGIILADLVLAGDNAVVIALAARNLPPELRGRAIWWGAAVAIALRATLTIIALFVLHQELAWVQIIGGLLLLWIAWRLALEEEDDHTGIDGATTIRGAVKIILVADVVMSIDNVLAVAAIARQNVDDIDIQIMLVVLGLLLSIPIVMGGAAVLLRVIDRFPVIVWIGAALIAYVGCELLLTDPASIDLVLRLMPEEWMHRTASMLLAAGLTAVAWWVRSRRAEPAT